MTKHKMQFKTYDENIGNRPAIKTHLIIQLGGDLLGGNIKCISVTH